MLRLPARTIAELDEMAGWPAVGAGEEAKVENDQACRVRHCLRLAEPYPPPKRLSLREGPAALRASLVTSEKG